MFLDTLYNSIFTVVEKKHSYQNNNNNNDENSNLGSGRRRGASHTASSGGPAAGCGTQSAGHNPHSGTASPLRSARCRGRRGELT